MNKVSLVNIIRPTYVPESYALFRRLEDWCARLLPREEWNFDYLSTMCCSGVDVPRNILFRKTEIRMIFEKEWIVD